MKKYRVQSKLKLAIGLALMGGALMNMALMAGAATRAITLRQCLETALAQNHALRIARCNPPIARLTLRASQGFYDPVLFFETRRHNDADRGGFDPADLSKDAVYEAQSHTAALGLTGILPSGMIYTLGGDYANSYGVRNSLKFDSYNLFAGVTLQQPLLKNFWIDQTRTTLFINRSDLKISELGVRYAAIDAANQVQQAYYELMFARENLAVQQQLCQTKSRFLRGIQRQIENGLMTMQEEQVALSQEATAQAGLLEAGQAVALAENQLLTAMGEPFTNRVECAYTPVERLVIVPQVLDYAESWDRGLAGRPDLVQLRQEVQKSDVNIKFRRNQLFPSLDLVAGFGRRGADTVQTLPFWDAEASRGAALAQIRGGDAPSDVIGIVFSIPLSRTTERANYRAAKEIKTQVLLLVKQKEELVMREIADALASASASRQRVEATRRAAQYAQAALVSEERKLAGGKSTILFVLQLQNDLAQAQTAELRAKADYNQALSQLHFAEATILERQGFEFKFE